MASQRVLITGAGRGIGLEVAKQYVERGDQVLAGCRSIERAPGLRRLVDEFGSRLTVVPLEVTSDRSISEAINRVSQEVEALDILINNAGISPGDVSREGPDGAPVFDAEPAMEMFRVNAVAPLRVAQSFVGLLKSAASAARIGERHPVGDR